MELYLPLLFYIFAWMVSSTRSARTYLLKVSLEFLYGNPKKVDGFDIPKLPGANGIGSRAICNRRSLESRWLLRTCRLVCHSIFLISLYKALQTARFHIYKQNQSLFQAFPNKILCLYGYPRCSNNLLNTIRLGMEYKLTKARCLASVALHFWIWLCSDTAAFDECIRL